MKQTTPKRLHGAQLAQVLSLVLGLSWSVLGLGVPAAAAQDTSVRYVVSVEGLACPFCVFGLERELKGIEGVAEVAVSLGDSRANVNVRPGAVVQPEALRAAIREAGFTPGAITLTLTGEVHVASEALNVALGSHASLPIVGGSALSGLRAAVAGGTTRFALTATVVRRGDADVLEVSAFHAR